MGFRTGVGTRDQLFNLRVLMENAYKASVPLYMTFVEWITRKHSTLLSTTNSGMCFKEWASMAQQLTLYCTKTNRQLVPLLTNKDISLTVRGRLYSSCVRSSMLHRSETWPVRKENEVALQRAEMRMVRWMRGVKLQDIEFR